MLAPVGKISKLFGLDGEVIANLYDTFPGDHDMEEPLFVMFDGLAVPLFLERFERRGRSGALMLFSDIDNPQRASELLSKEILLDKGASGVSEGSAPKESLSEEELLPESLIGFSAVITAGSAEEGEAAPVTGTITDFFDSELNPLFQITAAGKEILLPVVDEFITGVDVREQVIEFQVPEGMLDLFQ